MQDVKDLLHSLSKKASTPDPRFREELRAEIQQRYNRSNIISSIISAMNRKLFYSLASIAGIALFAAGGFFWYTSRNYTEVLSVNSRTEVLASYLKNNSASTLNAKKNPTSRTAGLTESATQEAADTMALSVAPIYSGVNPFSYSFQKVTTTEGPVASQCQTFAQQGSRIDHSYSFVDSKDGRFYSKNYSFDKDQNLLQYSIMMPDGNLNYLGGKYAVKHIYSSDIRVLPLKANSEPVLDDEGQGNGQSEPSNLGSGSNEPMEEPGGIVAPAPGEKPDSNDNIVDSIEDYIKMYFSQADKVEKIVRNGQVESYRVTWTYKSPCDFQYRSALGNVAEIAIVNEDGKTIIVESLLDPETYQVVKEISYLEKVTKSTVLSTSEIEPEQKEAQWGQVKDKFNFDYKVTVREIRDRSFGLDAQRAQLRAYLTGKSITTLTPIASGFKMSSAFSPQLEFEESGMKFVTDREFYPNNDFGQKLYNEAVKQSGTYIGSLLPMLSTSFTSSSKPNAQVEVMVFSKSTDTRKFVELYAKSTNTTVDQNDVEAEIDGKTVRATVVKIDWGPIMIQDATTTDAPESSNQSVSSDDVITKSDPDTKTSNWLALFDYGKFKYAVSVNMFDSTLLDGACLRYNILTIASRAEIDKLLKQIEALQGPAAKLEMEKSMSRPD